MTDASATVAHLETVLWHQIGREKNQEARWMEHGEVKEARRCNRAVDGFYKLIERIAEVKQWHTYKHGIGS